MHPKTQPSLRIGAATLALALGLTACGGGGDGPDSTPAPSAPSAPSVQAPAIAAQPASQSVAAGQAATFTVGAAGSTLAYQWQRDGKDIAGANAASYTLANVQAADNGAGFSVIVKNSAGSVTSSPAVLTVTAAKGLVLVAGAYGGAGNLDGADARFAAPDRLAIGPGGALYVADDNSGLSPYDTPYNYLHTGQFSLRRLDPASAAVTTVDAKGMPSGLVAMAFDAAGNRYDATASAIYKTVSGGQRSLFAGSETEAGQVDGANGSARFLAIADLALDAGGNLVVADTYALRKLTPAGVVSTLAGSAPTSGNVAQQHDGPAAQALFSGIGSLAVEPGGAIDVIDGGVLRRLSAAGVVSTPTLNDPAQPGAVNFPMYGGGHIAADASGTIYVADNYMGCRVRRIAPNGVVTDLAGAPGKLGNTDGKGAAAAFCAHGPVGQYESRALGKLVLDAAGNLYLGDTDNKTIRRITSAGDVTTIAGRATQPGNVDATGAAARFALSPTLRSTSKPDVFPYYSLAADAAGNVYVGEGDRIREVFPNGAVGTLVHPGNAGSMPLILPSGLVYGGGALVVSDRRIGRVDASGNVVYIAGQTDVRGNADGQLATASFVELGDPVVDGLGNIYVADRRYGLTDTVDPSPLERRIGADGTVTTLPQPAVPHAAWFADKDGTLWDLSTDGTISKVGADGKRSLVRSGAAVPGATALALARDAAGNLYVGWQEAGNWYAVHKITPSGADSIIAGSNGSYGVRPGQPGSLGRIDGLAATPDGALHVLSENAVLRIVP